MTRSGLSPGLSLGHTLTELRPGEDQEEVESFKPREGGCTLGTIYHLAREAEREANAAKAPGEAGQSGADGPTITLQAGKLAETATKAEAALIMAQVPIYQYAEELQRPTVEEVEASKGRRTHVARFAVVTADALRDQLSRHVKFERWNERKKGLVAADPPREMAATILSRVGEWRFPPAAGVITTPTLRPDGSILSAAGYDPATRLILMQPPAMPDIAAKPTKDDAAAALQLLDALLTEFPFVDAASRSVALSELITPVVRGAMAVAPLHANRAP